MGPILDKHVRDTFQGIKKWSASNGHDMNTALIRHAKDRLLARIGTSQHAEDVVLKGGLLMGALLLDIARPTKDIDLVFVEDADETRVMDVLRAAAAQPSADPWTYDLENAKVERLAGEEWHAIRVRFEARMGATRTPMCIDATSGMVGGR
ncbi:nucleotidyl transferase AbiEii/AbiGii toxin family protein [Roseomonas genomospecies 6]|uniref:Nucleotidyl transferase AbiEii/AbiGii toxin family protein n=1 Tax=Roseomonas genomospecies 6 TaxID=214106 RepID=A0A9W7NGH3_9PROT|nr:nucleotidyl transferase AbiEii/AbiGii toxin family protein [Roseomonas genomospecies 6]KAA0677630.1 hypothetical protein DS843_22585 [Roseomonas genomospecies 6]